MGNRAPGLIKGPHDGRLQGPFLDSRQVLFQLLQAGCGQDDRIPAEVLQGETARRHTHPCQDLGSNICVFSPLAMSDSDPKDCSPPGSSVHGIFQAKILKWVAISPRVSSQLGLNPSVLHFLHWQADSLPLSRQEAPNVHTLHYSRQPQSPACLGSHRQA